MKSQTEYYIPHGSYWPILGSVALAVLLAGAANAFHGEASGTIMMIVGSGLLIFMIFGWLGQVINESESGTYNLQVDRSFRWGMGWFIFSEVMFFGAFFGALFYARSLSVPWLGGASNNEFSYLLWPEFKSIWPLLSMPDTVKYLVPHEVIGAWDVPILNTLTLLLSGATITFAHWGLKINNRNFMLAGLTATIALGVFFLFLQATEYMEAYQHLDLKLNSGIYGSTFFMLTGFHGLHVTLGTLMLIVILMRTIRGHFNHDRHFGFEAVAWYWHFVDVVWLGLFIFVYWY